MTFLSFNQMRASSNLQVTNASLNGQPIKRLNAGLAICNPYAVSSPHLGCDGCTLSLELTSPLPQTSALQKGRCPS